MSSTDIEIVVDDPTAPEPDSPAVTSTGAVDIGVSLLLLALALILGWDNWRTGAAEYHLEVWRSFAGYVLGLLQEASQDFVASK